MEVQGAPSGLNCRKYSRGPRAWRSLDRDLPVSIWISRMTHLLFPLLFFLPAVDWLLSLLPTHQGHAKMMAPTPELPAPCWLPTA